MTLKQDAIAFAYDVAMQGAPGMIFVGPHRRQLIEPLTGLVLEIGAGTGLSLRYYSPGVRLVATELDLASVTRMQGKAAKARARVAVVAADAMSLPFADATFDGLVCNLALCTIPDPARALSEAKRVLKPGAPLRFLEHVRASGPFKSQVQDFVAPAWSRFAGGCRLNQDTERIIRDAGLRVDRVESRGGLLLPMKLLWASNREHMK
ncbi:MAG: class I SAM-dependent methyltransferase [Chloroflexota bacterium]